MKAWSPYQQAVFAAVEARAQNLAVQAVAGSGKTTTIVEAAKRLKGSAYLAAFNKKMGDELSARVQGMPGKQAGTFHSVGYKALSGRYGPLSVKGKKISEEWYERADKDERLIGLGPAVVKLVSLAKQAMLSSEWDVGEWDAVVEHFGVMDDAPEGAEVEEVVHHAQTMMEWSLGAAREGLVDFDDMLYVPLHDNLRVMKFNTIFVDEAQDTNPARRLLTQAMCWPESRVIAVGDPHQAIYGFSGAGANAMDDMIEHFDMAKLPLSICYRCAKSVVKEAQRYLRSIEAFEGAEEGQVSEAALRELLAQKPQPTDALLCRFNRPLVRVAFELIRAGVPTRIEGRDIGESLLALSKKWPGVRTLGALSEKLVEWADREQRKHMARKRFSQAQAVADKVGAMGALIDRTRELKGGMAELQALIKEMFQDTDGRTRKVFTLSSVHKAKGLEWPRVFVLGKGEVMPSPYAKQPWELQQEQNLVYVAVTRAEKELVYLSGVEDKVEVS